MKIKPFFLFLMSVTVAAIAFFLPNLASPPTPFAWSEQIQVKSVAAQTSPCMAFLLEAAAKAGVQGTITRSDDTQLANGGFLCGLDFAVNDGDSRATGTSIALRISPIREESPCEYPEDGLSTFTTFHGYEARARYESDKKFLEWCMYKGNRFHYPSVSTFSSSIEKYGPAQDPAIIADVVWSLAEDRFPLIPVEDITAPPVAEEEAPQALDPAQPEETFTLPFDVDVTAGSIAVPIAGALLGAAASAAFSLLSAGTTAASTAAASAATAASTAGSVAASSAAAAVSTSTASAAEPPPKIITQDGQELYWSERPWDEAGPGYVTREEYEFTQRMLSQGYRWTQRYGWQTPEELQQSEQWAEISRHASDQQHAEWRAEYQANQEAIQQQREEINRRIQEMDLYLDVQAKLPEFQQKLEAINQSLLDQNIYVANPLQGDPSLLLDGVSKAALIGWSYTAGFLTNARAMTCEEYVFETYGNVYKAVKETFGNDTKVQSIIFQEKSTVKPQGFWDRLDKLYDDNHILIKVTMPDGSEYAVDFHQHNDQHHPQPLLLKWKLVKERWQRYLGDDFTERFYMGDKP